MENIIVFPKNKKQKTLLKSLLEEMKVNFVMGKNIENIALTKEEFIEKINKSLNQAESGETIKLSPDQQKELLNL